jgi:hypothetical protein
MVKSVKIDKTLKGRLNFNTIIKESIPIVSINTICSELGEVGVVMSS